MDGDVKVFDGVVNDSVVNGVVEGALQSVMDGVANSYATSLVNGGCKRC